jgi:hypothetical protein
MGRQAKIRQQRKQSALGEASPTSGKPLSQDAAKISSLVNKPSPELESESDKRDTSWWGRITQ